MKYLLALIPVIFCLNATPLAAQEKTIAVIGLVHSHVWGHLGKLAKGEGAAKLVGVAEPNPELVEEARKAGVASELIFSDYKQMLDQAKPDIVWAFVENNRHLEIAKVCAPRKIHLMYEKPLASTYRDALEIRDLARKHGIQVLTNYQMAWWPSNYTAKSLADSGALGKVWRLRGVVGHGGPGSEGPRNRHFFDWLTDPVKNGGGALVDFQCYNALWSLWYLGKPETVFARVNQFRPERYPKVEDSSAMILHYKDGVGLFEGSWNLPRSFQDLEVFGREGSVMMTRDRVEHRAGRQAPREAPIEPLTPENSDPIAYMVHVLRTNRSVEGLTALDINVDVVEIFEAAKQSAATGKAVPLPLSGKSGRAAK